MIRKSALTGSIALAFQHLLVGVDLLHQAVDGGFRDIPVSAAVSHGLTVTIHDPLHLPVTHRIRCVDHGSTLWHSLSTEKHLVGVPVITE